MNNAIRWQCRRGMLELDVILNRFLDQRYASLSFVQKNIFSELLKQDDPTLFDWLVAGVPCNHAPLREMVTQLLGSHPTP